MPNTPLQDACDRVNAATLRHKELVAAAGGQAKLAALTQKRTVRSATVFQSPIPAWVRWACAEIGKEWRSRHAAEEANRPK